MINLQVILVAFLQTAAALHLIKVPKEFMESRFGNGYDFSNVRIHTDGVAGESSSSINALAYTLGNHMVFGYGQYQPHTSQGQKLVAHELTHIVQQTGSSSVIARQPTQVPLPPGSGKPIQKPPENMPEYVADIPTDQTDFVGNFYKDIRTRIIIRLNSWASDYRAALSDFETTMGDVDNHSFPYHDVISSWVGTLGVFGDITNAIFTTVWALVPDTKTNDSFSDFISEVDSLIVTTREKTDNTKSDLPIYIYLRSIEKATRDTEFIGPLKTGQKRSDLKNRSQQIVMERHKREIDIGLAKWPNTRDLKHVLIDSWINQFGKQEQHEYRGDVGGIKISDHYSSLVEYLPPFGGTGVTETSLSTKEVILL